MINMTIDKVDCADSYKSAICSLSVVIPKLVWLMLFLTFSLVLSGCGGGHDRDFYVRVTVDATFNGRPVSGSSVVLQPWIHSAPRGYTQGEAVSIELGGEKKIYMPLADRGGQKRVYVAAISKTFQYIYSPDGKRLPREEKLKRLFEIPYGTKAKWPYKWEKKKPDVRGKYTNYPLLVGFSDEEVPCSNFIVETERADRVFGGTFRFKGVTLERMPPDTPLTTGLIKNLPWLEESHPVWAGGSVKGFCGLGGDEYLDNPKRVKKLNRRHFKFSLGR